MKWISSLVIDFDFTSMCAPRFFGEIENEIGGFLAGAAEHHFAAVRDHVRFELLEIVIEILDGVLLDGVGFVAQILIIGQSLGADALAR